MTAAEDWVAHEEAKLDAVAARLVAGAPFVGWSMQHRAVERHCQRHGLTDVYGVPDIHAGLASMREMAR